MFFLMSTTKNIAPLVKMVLLIRIFAVVNAGVRVNFSPGYSICPPPSAVSLARSFSSFYSFMSTTKYPYVTVCPAGTSEL
jgi:hypothetical protein